MRCWQCGQRNRTCVTAASRCRRTVGSDGAGGGPPGAAPVFPPQPQVLQEGERDQAQQRMVVQARPRAALEVVEAKFVLQLLVGLLNGLITNDKFCLTRPGRLRLSWSRARGRSPAPAYPPGESTHRGGEHATAAHLARPAHRRADGDRPAALGPGLPAPPALGGDEPTRVGEAAGAPYPAGGVPCV